MIMLSSRPERSGVEKRIKDKVRESKSVSSTNSPKICASKSLSNIQHILLYILSVIPSLVLASPNCPLSGGCHGLSPFTTPKLCLLTFDLCTPKHDYHVSITHIDHNPTTQSLEITTKIFTDDLERAITTLGGPILHLGDPKEHPQSNTLIHQYLQNRLQITTNGKKATLLWVGKEVELDATYIYLEIKTAQIPKELQIQNAILTEIFPDQSNLIHATVNKTRKSLNLNTLKPSDCLIF
jgi:hypothetical protein